MKRTLALLLASLFGGSSAQAQIAPGAPSANTVIFSAGTNLNDQSAVIAAPSNFFYPLYNALPGTGIIQKFNRLQIGISALTSNDLPQTITLASLWGATYPNTSTNAQLAVTSALGTTAIFGGSRTSDYKTWKGTSTGGSGAIAALGVQDDTSGVPINCVFCAYQYHVVAGIGISLSQFDSNNLTGSNAAVPTPQNHVTGGSMWGVGITAGAQNTALANSSAAIYVGGGSFNSTWETGIIFFNNALDTTQGVGGGGVAESLGSGQSIRWMNASNSTVSEIYGDANGLEVSGAVSLLQIGSAPSNPISGGGRLYSGAAVGSVLTGNGSSYDVVLANSSQAVVLSVNHASTTVAAAGNFRAAGSVSLETGTAIPVGGSSAFGVLMSNTASFGIFYGSGAPVLSAAQGSIYLRSDGSSTTTRLYVNTTGSTVWTPVTTGS